MTTTSPAGPPARLRTPVRDAAALLVQARGKLAER